MLQDKVGSCDIWAICALDVTVGSAEKNAVKMRPCSTTPSPGPSAAEGQCPGHQADAEGLTVHFY